MRGSRPVELPSDVATRLAHFDLLTEIARGPRGSLWAAHSSEGDDAGRLVAVRKIDRASLDESSITKLRAAGAIARKIRDPKVVAVLDVVVTDRDAAIVSEYIDGEPLSSLQRLAAQKGTSVPIGVAMRIALDLLTGARGAAEAFRSRSGPPKPGTPSLHGAISPECALVASFGETMLTDIGVAGIGNHLPGHPGAMRYWAPERFDDARALDERADVFSIGVLLWELIANEPLFGSRRVLSPSDDDVDSIKQKVCAAPIARLDAARRAGAPIPKKVADVVARALERDRATRFQSVDEMIRAILLLDGALGTTDEVTTLLDRLARPILEARRAALGQLSDRLNSRDSAPPESARGTYRPPAPTASVPPVVPRSPNVPLSMLMAMAGGKTNSQPPAANKAIPSAPPRPSAARGASGKPLPPRPATAPPRDTYRAVPPPRPGQPADAAPAALPPVPQETRRWRPPLPVRPPSSRPPMASDEVDTGRLAPRWQAKPPPPPEATKEDLGVAAASTPPLPAASRPPPLPKSRPPPTPAASRPPSSLPKPATENDAKGPFGWAPDDPPQPTDVPPEDISGAYLPLGRRGVRAALLGGGVAAVLLVAVVLIGSSSSKSSATDRSTAAASVQEAPPPPVANDLPALLPPPVATDATAAPAEAAPPVPSSAPSDSADPATPAQEGAPSSPSRGVRPQGGDRPKSGNDEPKFRPRGI